MKHTSLLMLLGYITVIILQLSAINADKCDSDNVVMSVTTFNGSIHQIAHVNQNRSEMYIRAGNLLYHSNDYGSSWDDVTHLMSNYYNTNESFNSKQYGCSRIIRTSFDSAVYFQGYGYIFWMTRDGITFKNESTWPHYLLVLEPHPNNARYILRIIYNIYSNQYLLQLSDYGGFGDSWVTIATNVLSFSWNSINQIFVLAYPTGGTRDDSQFFIYNLLLEAEEDQPKVELVYESADTGYLSMLYTEDILYLGKEDEENKDLINLYLSADQGQTVNRAIFSDNDNVQSIPSSRFFIESSNEGVSFVIVADVNNTNVGDLYVASVYDAEYTITLKNVVISNYGTDFQELYSLPGTFFANAYNITSTERYDPNFNATDKIKSAISFNKGGLWLPIGVLDSPTCNGSVDCSLNFFSFTSDYGHLKSSNFSTGVVLGLANQGQYRTNSTPSFYLSRNAGYSFEMIKEGIWTFSFSSHAAVMVASNGEDNQFEYTWDQGLSWNVCSFGSLLPNQSIETSLEYIYQASLPSDTKFFAYGDYNSNTSFVLSLNFPITSVPACQGEESPDQPESDYETWVPELNSSCSLGTQRSYVRRKRDAACYPTSEIVTSSVSCGCTRNDYTCDGTCWQERIRDGKSICVNICIGTRFDPQLPPLECNGSYLQTQGYRKVAGDKCTGGDAALYEPILVPCPPSPSPSPSTSISRSPSPTVTVSVSSTVTLSPSPTVTTSVTPSASHIVEVIQSSTPTTEDGNGDDDNNNNQPDTAKYFGLLALLALLIVIAILALLVIIIVLYKTNARFRGIVKKCLPSKCRGEEPKKLYSVLGEDLDFDNSLGAQFGTEMEETN